MNEQLWEQAEQAYQLAVEEGLDRVVGGEYAMRRAYPRVVRDALAELYAVIDREEQEAQA